LIGMRCLKKVVGKKLEITSLKIETEYDLLKAMDLIVNKV
jgi:hypothetical protein